MHSDVTDVPCVELYRLYMKNGDQLALEELYRRTRPIARSLVTRLLGTPAETDDVLQEVWVALLNRNPVITSSFEGYVYRAVLNRTRDLLRARSRRPLLSFGDLEEDEQAAAIRRLLGDASPAETVATKLYVDEQFARSVRLLHNRNADWCKAFVLWFSGLDYGEIATALGVERGRVQKWMQRAFALLQQRVGATTTGEDGR